LENPSFQRFPAVDPPSMNFFQKPFDSPKSRSYIRATDGDDALGGRKAFRFS
jgi:hypothetical protein